MSTFPRVPSQHIVGFQGPCIAKAWANFLDIAYCCEMVQCKVRRYVHIYIPLKRVELVLSLQVAPSPVCHALLADALDAHQPTPTMVRHFHVQPVCPYDHLPYHFIKTPYAMLCRYETTHTYPRPGSSAKSLSWVASLQRKPLASILRSCCPHKGIYSWVIVVNPFVSTSPQL